MLDGKLNKFCTLGLNSQPMQTMHHNKRGMHTIEEEVPRGSISLVLRSYRSSAKIAKSKAGKIKNRRG